MASPEVFRPQPDQNPSEHRPIKSQLGKYVGHSETRIPQGKEWARLLVEKIPERYKIKVAEFISGLEYEERQEAAQHLSELIDVKGDQIWRSRYPEMEFDQCIEETRQWLDIDSSETVN